jgi:hypothetical protein
MPRNWLTYNLNEKPSVCIILAQWNVSQEWEGQDTNIISKKIKFKIKI